MVVGLAPIIFISIESRLIAGLVAGAIFVSLGVFIVAVGAQVRAFRKTPTFWAGVLHLFGSALPLLITRMMGLSKNFEDVRVLGISGPVFHQVSTGIFAVLLIATAFDLVRSWRRRVNSV